MAEAKVQRHDVLRPCSFIVGVTSPAGRRVWVHCTRPDAHNGPHALSNECSACGQALSSSPAARVETPAEPVVVPCNVSFWGRYRGTVLVGGLWEWKTMRYRTRCVLPAGHKGQHLDGGTT